MAKTINGIQQIGIGVSDARRVFDWYRKHLGFDILVFDDIASADLMVRYTGNVVRDRLALLAMNMIGGGGLEIWQFKNRKPEPPRNPLQLGDLGINLMKLRTKYIEEIHHNLTACNTKKPTPIYCSSHFYFDDIWQNWVQMVRDDYSFTNTKQASGGVLGAVIGVSNMENSMYFYKNLFGYDTVVEDRSAIFDDFSNLPGGKGKFRRVLLSHGKRSVGGFGELYGPSQIELLQALDRCPNSVYQGRIWGDLGYIHLCFDVHGMDLIREEAEHMGYPFTVDSADSFDMGDAAGRFGYLEDPDGTLIEMVETHRVPIFKRLGIYINLKKRHHTKPLPQWLVKMMRVHRIRG